MINISSYKNEYFTANNIAFIFNLFVIIFDLIWILMNSFFLLSLPK